MNVNRWMSIVSIMGWMSIVGLVLTAAAVQPAFAGDEELFAGLVPGVALADEELAEIYGKGTISIGGEFIGDIDAGLDADQLSNISNNAGITTPIQFVGDNNVVTVQINIDIDIGTVSVIDSDGSNITAIPDVSLGLVDVNLGR